MKVFYTFPKLILLLAVLIPKLGLAETITGVVIAVAACLTPLYMDIANKAG